MTQKTDTLTKAEAKLIRSLAQKKYRDELQLFLAEGPKVVGELLRYFPCRMVVATAEWLAENKPACSKREVTETELSRLSLLKAPQDVLAVFGKPSESTTEALKAPTSLALALDGIQDPGNLGTIIRTADWMGIRSIYASTDTADCYAPKVVQATMGALGRIRIHYGNLTDTLTRLQKEGLCICGTFMQGENLYEATIPTPAVIVMGNEGNGIRPDVETCCQRRLTIPRYAPEAESSESLNVAIATAIVCSELKRRT